MPVTMHWATQYTVTKSHFVQHWVRKSERRVSYPMLRGRYCGILVRAWVATFHMSMNRWFCSLHWAPSIAAVALLCTIALTTSRPKYVLRFWTPTCRCWTSKMPTDNRRYNWQSLLATRPSSVFCWNSAPTSEAETISCALPSIGPHVSSWVSWLNEQWMRWQSLLMLRYRVGQVWHQVRESGLAPRMQVGNHRCWSISILMNMTGELTLPGWTIIHFSNFSSVQSGGFACLRH